MPQTRNALRNGFVDLEVDMGGGKVQAVRYQVLMDEDRMWYFNPQPDLSYFFSMGLNEESESTEEWSARKQQR